MKLDIESIRNHIQSHFRAQEELVRDDTPLFSSGLLDSFILLDLIAFLEKQEGFRVKASEMTLSNFDSIEKITAFLSRKTA